MRGSVQCHRLNPPTTAKSSAAPFVAASSAPSSRRSNYSGGIRTEAWLFLKLALSGGLTDGRHMPADLLDEFAGSATKRLLAPVCRQALSRKIPSRRIEQASAGGNPAVDLWSGRGRLTLVDLVDGAVIGDGGVWAPPAGCRRGPWSVRCRLREEFGPAASTGRSSTA